MMEKGAYFRPDISPMLASLHVLMQTIVLAHDIDFHDNVSLCRVGSLGEIFLETKGVVSCGTTLFIVM